MSDGVCNLAAGDLGYQTTQLPNPKLYLDIQERTQAVGFSCSCMGNKSQQCIYRRLSISHFLKVRVIYFQFLYDILNLMIVTFNQGDHRLHKAVMHEVLAECNSPFG